MNKFVSFNGIGYLAATFPVSKAAQQYLKKEHTKASTGNVDVNGKNLAVKLNNDGTVGFGASTPTSEDALLGILIAYEMDGFATIQVKGGIDEVPTKSEITTGLKSLVVNDKGQIEELDAKIAASSLTKGGKETFVVLPSESNNLYASIIL